MSIISSASSQQARYSLPRPRPQDVACGVCGVLLCGPLFKGHPQTSSCPWPCEGWACARASRSLASICAYMRVCTHTHTHTHTFKNTLSLYQKLAPGMQHLKGLRHVAGAEEWTVYWEVAQLWTLWIRTMKGGTDVIFSWAELHGELRKQLGVEDGARELEGAPTEFTLGAVPWLYTNTFSSLCLAFPIFTMETMA